MIKHKCKCISLSCIFLLINMIIISLYPLNVKAATTITNGRIEGIDRYATAAEVAKAGWKTTSQDAIVVTGEDFADALCSAPLAKIHNAPILLTESLKLNDSAKEELIRLNVKNVIIVGGTGAVSDNTESQIKTLGISTSRIGGIDRYDTSVKIANELGTSSSVTVATGNNFPDALSIASIAAMKGMPILLTDQNKISDGTKNYLKSNFITKTYVVGGVGVISDNVFNSLINPERIAGINRYETNTKVLNKFSSDLSLSSVYIATGNNFPDALSNSVLASNTKSPIVLTDDNANNYTKTYINSNINLISNVIAVGGTGVITNAQIQKLINYFKTSLVDFTVKTSLYYRTDPNNFYIGDQKSISANATSLNGVKYKFCVKNLNTGEYKVLQDFSSNNSILWTSTYGGKYEFSVYARDSSSQDTYEDQRSTDINVVQNAKDSQRVQTALQKKLIDYLLSSKENRDSVMKRAIELHGGVSANTCVYFTSEALRRVGLSYLPNWVCNTHQLSDKLTSYGWSKCTDYTRVLPGDLCFTINGWDAYPTHVYTFIDWVKAGDYQWAYVIDNQDYNSNGDHYHLRVINVSTGKFDKIQYFMHMN